RLLLSEDSGLQLLLIVRIALATLLCLCAAACGDKKPPPPSCDDTFIGDPSLPPEGVLVVTDGVMATLSDVGDGAMVPLVRPPQGGQVTYAGARVRNMNRCGVQFTGRFRDPATRAELGFDRRSTDLIVGGDGWGRPDPAELSTLANIPLCPDFDPIRDMQGVTALLEITVQDRHQHMVMLSRSVVPTCVASDAAVRALCVCECSHLPAGSMRACGSGVGDGGM